MNTGNITRSEGHTDITPNETTSEGWGGLKISDGGTTFIDGGTQVITSNETMLEGWGGN